MTPDPERLQSIRERLQKITQYPWSWSMEDGSVMALYGPEGPWHHVLWCGICRACQERGGRCTAPNDANADLIAHAPEDLAYLLNLVEGKEG